MSIGTTRVKELVSENLEHIRTASDLAQMLHVSTRTLRRDFVHREGITLWRYIRRIRNDRAKELLLHSDLDCRQILLAVGFSREEVGARAFKRATGLTMKQYRKLGGQLRAEDFFS